MSQRTMFPFEERLARWAGEYQYEIRRVHETRRKALVLGRGWQWPRWVQIPYKIHRLRRSKKNPDQGGLFECK